jgi:hypothetical protein
MNIFIYLLLPTILLITQKERFLSLLDLLEQDIIL